MSDARGRAREAEDRAGEQLAHKLVKIRALAQHTAFMIPELDADPDVDDQINLWMMTDGRLCWRTSDDVVRRVTGTTGGSPTSGVAAESDPDITEHLTEYTPTWARTFCSSHGIETGNELWYGDSPNHPGASIMIGFDTAQIQADLGVATVREVEIKVLNLAALGDTVDIHWGSHLEATAPADFAADRVEVWVEDWPKVGYGGDADGYHAAPNWIGRSLADGTSAGLIIAQPNGLPHYGRIDATTVRVAITYTV